MTKLERELAAIAAMKSGGFKKAGTYSRCIASGVVARYKADGYQVMTTTCEGGTMVVILVKK